jgi:hypothetical protein
MQPLGNRHQEVDEGHGWPDAGAVPTEVPSEIDRSRARRTPAVADRPLRSAAHAIRLDREAASEIRKGRLHQKAATAILFESNGGQLKAEASIGEIKAALGGPDVNLADSIRRSKASLRRATT